MKWTVAYSTTDIQDQVCFTPIDVPLSIAPRNRVAYCHHKFAEIFRACFGNELNYIIRDIHPGYERKEPEEWIAKN